MAAAASEIDERLWHEGRTQSVLLGDRFHHVFEESVPVGGPQCTVVLPIHLELAVRILMIVLVRLPADGGHGVTNLGDNVVAAHQRLLIVTRLGLLVGGIGNGFAVRRDHEVLAFDAGLELIAFLRRRRDHTLEHLPRILGDLLSAHDEISSDPGHFRLPGQLNQAARVGHCQDVRVCRRHVEPSGEAGESGTGFGNCIDRASGHDLSSHGAEQIEEGNEEIFDPLLFCSVTQRWHVAAPVWNATPPKKRGHVPSCPGIQFVPASGTRAMAADSTVSATRSSGSRLWTCDLPQARAMV